MQDIYLNHWGFALGDRSVSVEETVEAGRTLTEAKAFLEAGFAQHWMADPETTAYDLGLRAAKGLEPHFENIGSIIYSTCLTLNGNLGRWSDFVESRDVKHLLDYPGSHLQAALNLPEASLIGLNQQACTSVLGSIRVARGLFAVEDDLEQVLCVSADRFPEGAIYEQAYNLISDGASAFLLSRQPTGFKVLSTAAITNGALARASDEETVGTYFNFTWKVIQMALQKAGVNATEIDWVVPQNTNLKAWQILSRVLGIPFAKVYAATLGGVGHIISSDNIVNLAALAQDERLRPGQKLLLCMAGYGLNWQAVVLERV